MADDRVHAAEIDVLAGSLRERLLQEPARDGVASDLRERIRELVEREAGMLDEPARTRLVARIVERSSGLGPLESLLADPAVDEIMVNGPERIWVERAGRIEPTDVRFDGETELRHTFGPEDLVANGTWAVPLRDLLAAAVHARCNILISGGTGSGKTTTLNALTEFIADGERIVTIEDAAELRLRHPHVVRLEARPASLEGRGEVTVRRLVRNALRMRPDRIVVGEVRGAEALDMLSAMSSGHDGSLSTVHAGSPEEALRRVETLALMAGLGLPHDAIREQVAGALDLVVHQARMADGARRVVAVGEVVRVAGGVGVRELYALHDGRPTWRAPVGDLLAARLADPPRVA